MPQLMIVTTDKETEARAHIEWTKNLPLRTIVVYSYRSKDNKNETTSGWSIQEQIPTVLSSIKEGECSIGDQSDI